MIRIKEILKKNTNSNVVFPEYPVWSLKNKSPTLWRHAACDTTHVYQHSDTSIDSIPVIGTTDKKQGCGVIGTKNTNPKGVETCSIWMKHLLHTSQS